MGEVCPPLFVKKPKKIRKYGPKNRIIQKRLIRLIQYSIKQKIEQKVPGKIFFIFSPDYMKFSTKNITHKKTIDSI